MASYLKQLSAQPEAIAAVVVATAFVIIQVVHARWCAVGAFVLVYALLYYYADLSVTTSIILSVLTASAVSLPLSTLSHASVAEQFMDKGEHNDAKDDERDKPKRKRQQAGGPDDDDEDVDEEDDEQAQEQQAQEQQAQEQQERSAETDSEVDEESDDEDDGGDDADPKPSQPKKKRPGRGPKVEAFETFMKGYKSLTPDQVENMTHDTKELIATQKSLMNTVKSLSPIVVQGKEMLDTFKDYFGNGSSASQILNSGVK
jgi:DNA-binding transcriptional regulator GbsR (MarR family)